MAKVRVIVPPGKGHAASLAHFVSSLQNNERRVLFVCADRPYAGLAKSLEEFGVKTSDMHFIDVVSSLSGSSPADRPRNATFLPSPTMLEMLAMRIEQVAQRLGPNAHVVLDSLDTLSLYNGMHPVQEFSHYLANRLRAGGLSGDFLTTNGPTGRQLHDLVIGFMDGRHDLPGAAQS